MFSGKTPYPTRVRNAFRPFSYFILGPADSRRTSSEGSSTGSEGSSGTGTSSSTGTGTGSGSSTGSSRRTDSRGSDAR